MEHVRARGIAKDHRAFPLVMRVLMRRGADEAAARERAMAIVASLLECRLLDVKDAEVGVPHAARRPVEVLDDLAKGFKP